MLSQVRLSRVLGQPVTTPGGETIGRVGDVVVRLVGSATPAVTGGVLRAGGSDTFVPIEQVAGLDEAGIHLSSEKVDRRPFERRPGEVLVDHDVVGHAVIDVERGQVVKVKDLVIERHGDRWDVATVVASPVGGVWAAIRRFFGRPEQEEELPWSNIVPLVGHVPTAGVRVAFARLAGLKPAEIADIVEQVSHEEGEEILEAVSADEELEADVFEELDEEHRVEFLKARSDPEAADVLSNMEPDHAADLLMQLPQERRRPVLELLEPDQKSKVSKLLAYGADTAGGLMNNEFVARNGTETAAEALGALRELEDAPAVLTDLFVTDGDGRLQGAIPLSVLVRAEPATQLASVMHEPEMVYADADLPSIAVLMADYNLASLPVVDEEGCLIGIVSYDDLIEAMLPDEWRWRGRPAAARVPEAASGPT